MDNRTSQILAVFAQAPDRHPNAYAYVRVSTEKQSAEAQLTELLNYCQKNSIFVPPDHIVIDEGRSGTIPWKQRRLGALIPKLRNGDLLLVPEISRLGRKMGEIQFLIQHFIDTKIILHDIKHNLRLDTTIGVMMIQMFIMFAFMERELTSERTKTGMANAVAKGKKLGRPVGKTGRSKLDAGAKTWLRMEADGKSYKDIGEVIGADPTTVRDWLHKRHSQADAKLREIPKTNSGERLSLLKDALELGPSKAVLAETMEGFKMHDPANHPEAAALVALAYSPMEPRDGPAQDISPASR
jgi:DNA invertase Pin-like site-specific DNA recombinase